MNTIDIALPFRRTYLVENGCARRTIEEFTVSLRVLDVSDLVKAVRSPPGCLHLEHDGFSLHYLGNTRETASFDALRRHMAAHAKFAGGKPYLNRVGSRPKSGIVDDGEAGILAAVAATESTYVVVEACVGYLCLASETRIGTRGFRHRRGDATLPWLEFPPARQAEALAVARSLRERLAAMLPNVRVVDAPPWEILDVAAAERMAVRAEAGRTRYWAETLIGYVRDVAGLLDSAAVRPFLALRDATEAGVSDAELMPPLREIVHALSQVRMPEGMEPGAWWPLRLAAVSLSCRLDALPAS